MGPLNNNYSGLTLRWLVSSKATLEYQSMRYVRDSGVGFSFLEDEGASDVEVVGNDMILGLNSEAV